MNLVRFYDTRSVYENQRFLFMPATKKWKIYLKKTIPFIIKKIIIIRYLRISVMKNTHYLYIEN